MHPVVFLSGWLVLAVLFALQEWVTERTWNYHLPFGKVYLLWAVNFLLWGIICWIIWWRLGEWIQSATLRSIILYVVPLSIVLSVVEEVIWVSCTWDIGSGIPRGPTCIVWAILSIRRWSIISSSSGLSS